MLPRGREVVRSRGNLRVAGPARNQIGVEGFPDQLVVRWTTVLDPVIEVQNQRERPFRRLVAGTTLPEQYLQAIVERDSAVARNQRGNERFGDFLMQASRG